MIRPKYFPSGSCCARNIKLDFWALPSLPPLETLRPNIKHPVRLKPVYDVVMAGYGDERRRFLFANCFFNRSAANFGDITIYHGRKFIENNARIIGQNTTGQFSPELLTIAQNIKRLQP